MTDETAAPPVDARRGAPDRAVAWMPYLLLEALMLVVLRSIAVRVSNPDTVAAELAPWPRNRTGLDARAAAVPRGYLTWRHPDLDFTVDGCTDADTTKHLEDQTAIIGLQPQWDTLLRRTEARYAFLPRKSVLACELVRAEGWRTLHASKDVALLQAPAEWGP